MITNKFDTDEFFKGEIIDTRISLDNARKEAWNEKVILFELQKQKRFEEKLSTKKVK